MATKTGPSLGTIQQDEHDHIAYAKRSVLVSKSGKTVSYEDTNFISSDSPAILDVFSDLGERGDGGYFVNDGSGNIKIEISDDGVSYGGQHTIKSGETLGLNGISINRIRITWVTDSSYRVLVGSRATFESNSLPTNAATASNQTDGSQRTQIDALPSIFNGTKTVPTGTAEAIASSQTIHSVTIKALSTNTALVYVGATGVTTANGFELDAGESVSLDVDNLSDVFVISATASQVVRYISI